MSAGLTQNSLLLLMYKFDQQLFVTSFCVNQDKPQMNCNGNCQLGKMAKEEQENEANRVLKQLQQDNLYSPLYAPVFLPPTYSLGFKTPPTITYWDNQYTYLLLQYHFQPPRFWS